jgi:hypothetical protein
MLPPVLLPSLPLELLSVLLPAAERAQIKFTSPTFFER